MRHIRKMSSIIGVFVFGVAFGLMSENAFAWNPYCPQPDKSAAAAALTSNSMSLVSIQEKNRLPAAAVRKMFRRVKRWIYAGCPGAFTGEGAERVWKQDPKYGVGAGMQEDAYLIGYTYDGLVSACLKAKEAKEAREREASLNKKLERLFILLSRMENRLESLERTR